jgi:hypothetical protein
MYRIPKDLDISGAVGQSTTQLSLGQYDLQFDPGEVHFAVLSRVTLTKAGQEIGVWEPGRWPDATFYDVMNVKVTSIQIPDDREIAISLEDGIDMHLVDDSDQYECMTITVTGSGANWII